MSIWLEEGEGCLLESIRDRFVTGNWGPREGEGFVEGAAVVGMPGKVVVGGAGGAARGSVGLVVGAGGGRLATV